MLRNFVSKLRGLSALFSSTPSHLPVEPKQILHDQYKIVRRLGTGEQATVWLAEKLSPYADLLDVLSNQQSIVMVLYSPNKLVAVKILTDEATLGQGKYSWELEVMKRLSRLPSSNVGVNHLPKLFEYFNARDTQGADHLCLVTEPLGSSLLQLRNSLDAAEEGRIPPKLVRHVVKQILQALQALHEQGIVHTDIKLDNIMFRPIGVEGDHELDVEKACADSVVLVDLGSAIPAEILAHRSFLTLQPEALRAPEVILGCKPTCKADIWNIGCIVFELLTGQTLFRPRPIQGFSAQHYHLARIFGSFAQDGEYERLVEFFQTGYDFKSFFEENDKSLYMTVDAAAREPLRRLLEIYNIYTPELYEFLGAMLRIHPDDRLSAGQLQSLAWLHI